MRISNGLSRRIALASASIAVTVIGLEVALRWLGAGPVSVNPDQRHFWVYHPQFGWTSRANHEGTFDSDYFKVHVAINSQGLRGPEVTLEKSASIRWPRRKSRASIKDKSQPLLFRSDIAFERRDPTVRSYLRPPSCCADCDRLVDSSAEARSASAAALR